MKKIFGFLSIFMLTILISCSNELNDKKDTPVSSQEDLKYTQYTLMVEKETPLQTLEPKDAVVLGYKFDKEENYGIKEFEKKVDKKANHYVYEYTLGSEFDTGFLIECIARNKIPFISISASEFNKYDLDEVQKISDIISSFYIDCYIELFPKPTSEMYDYDKYKEHFKNSSEIFKNDIENVSIIYTASTDDLYSSNKFYPDEDYLDFVGFYYIGYILENEDTLFNDFFNKFNYVYKTYSGRKPIFITKFAISHFSLKSHGYYISENIEYTNEIFSKLNSDYKRVKGINILDVDATKYPLDNDIYNDDNYKFTENDKILENMNAILNHNIFLSEYENDEQKDSVKHFYDAYLVDDKFYVVHDIFENDFFADKNFNNQIESTLIDNKKCYSLDEICSLYSVNYTVDRINKIISI